MDFLKSELEKYFVKQYDDIKKGSYEEVSIDKRNVYMRIIFPGSYDSLENIMCKMNSSEFNKYTKEDFKYCIKEILPSYAFIKKNSGFKKK